MFDTAKPIGDLKANAADAAVWLKKITCPAPELPIILVGISMGGIIARLAAVHPACPRPAHLVPISSPHSGTWSAYYGIGAAGRQLRVGSVVLRGLASEQLACPVTAIWTPGDSPKCSKLAG